MDEDQFRTVYHEINAQRCIFEKAITNRRCDCQYKQRFLLATREGIGCAHTASLQVCTDFLQILRDKSRFALRETFIDGVLPHNKELKVQAGGTLMLQTLLQPQVSEAQQVQNIAALLTQALTEFSNLTQLPYGELVKGVVHYQVRSVRTPRNP